MQFLPTSIDSLGLTISLDEAIDLLAFGKTGLSGAHVFESSDGDIRFIAANPDLYAEAAKGNMKPLEKSNADHLDASGQILMALQQGELHAFLTIEGEWRVCFRVAQAEWHRFTPYDFAARVTQDFPCSDTRLDGRTPMLAKASFEQWSAKQEPNRELTGDPGRPELGAALYMEEFHRRKDEGLLEGKVAHEAAHLVKWFKSHHTKRQAPGVGTVENRIRADFKKATKITL